MRRSTALLTLAVLGLAPLARAGGWQTVAENRWGQANITQRTDARTVETIDARRSPVATTASYAVESGASILHRA